MSIPNPLKIKLQGRQKVLYNEDPLRQIGTDLDHQQLYPPKIPLNREEAKETLTDDNTIFISHGLGNDGNTGSYASPKQTVEGAILAAQSQSDIQYLCFKDSSYTYVENTFIAYPYTLYNDSGTNSIYKQSYRTLPALNDSNCFFVNFKTGDDNLNSGTQTSPFATVNKAAQLMNSSTDASKYICVLVDDNFTEEEKISLENVEICIPDTGADKERGMYVATREGVDSFKLGQYAVLKYDTISRETLSDQRYWESFFYEPGKFQQGGLDTIYCGCREGTTPRMYYSTDGINWNVIATNPFPARVFNFCWMHFSGTDYIFCGTDSGVYRSSDGLNWTVTGLSSGGYYVYTWNNHVLTTGVGGVKRSSDGGSSWNTIQSSAGYVEMVELGEYLYYADNNNVIKRLDTSWTATTFCTVSELSLVKNLVVYQGYLYAAGWNSTSNTWYLIKIDSSGAYEIIHLENYSGNECLKYMLVINDRLYINKIFSTDGLVAFDGYKFSSICSLQNDCYYMHYGFKNRLYYSLYNQNQRIKYAIIDNVSLTNQGSDCDFKMEGFILDGYNGKARSCIICEKTDQLNLYCRYNHIKEAFYSGIKMNQQSLLYCDNVILSGLTYGLIHPNIFSLSYSLFYNIEEMGAYSLSPSLSLDHCTFDLVKTAARNWYQVKYCVFSRSPILLNNDSIVGSIQYSLLDKPFKYSNAQLMDNLLSAPTFRNRDGQNSDHSDYRLQRKWIIAPNSQDRYYKFSSIGVEAYLDSGYSYDYGCYAPRRSLYSSDYQSIFELDFYPQETTYGWYFNHGNQFISITGIKQLSHRGEQNKIVLPWFPSSPEEMKKIKDLYCILRSDTKALLSINPWDCYSENELVSLAMQNDLGIFSGPSSIGGTTVKAKFDPGSLTLFQNEYNWSKDEFRGWKVIIRYKDTNTYTLSFKIIKNTEDTLYLKDTDGLHAYPDRVIYNTHPDQMLFIIGDMDVRCNIDKLSSNLATYYKKATTPLGCLEIELIEA